MKDSYLCSPQPTDLVFVGARSFAGQQKDPPADDVVRAESREAVGTLRVTPVGRAATAHGSAILTAP